MTTPWHRSPEILAALDAYALALAEADAQWAIAGNASLARPVLLAAIDARAECDRVLRAAIKVAGKVARTTNGSRAEAPEPSSVGHPIPKGTK